MGDDKDEFKVVDRRGTRDTEPAKPAEPQKGEGFTMKEADEAPDSPPNKLDFATLVFSFATSALIQMGAAPDPVTNKVMRDLALAKQNIDILEILAVKTKGNLSEEEQQLIDGLLMEVRVRFVEATKRG